MNVLPEINADFYRATLPVLILCVGCIVSMLQSVSLRFGSSAWVSVFMIFSQMSAFVATATGAWENNIFLDGSYITSPMNHLGQSLILFVSICLSLLTLKTFMRPHFFRGEVACLFQMSLAGMLVMISSDDLITLFVGLELSSLGIYALVGYILPSRFSQEGAIKYFILGSFATAVLLFGFSLLYTATGTLNITEMIVLLKGSQDNIWVKLGLIFTLVGFGFKLSLAPFHLWTPDAYESAPSNITAFMATCVKVTMLFVVQKIFFSGTSVFAPYWIPALTFMSIVSMLFGNILALVQNSLKRIFAYSSIAHSGYLAIALCSIDGSSSLANSAIVFYLIGYICTLVLAFGIIMWLEDDNRQNICLEDLRGLAKHHPWLAFAMSAALFSFAGLPPTVGFIGKLFVFNSALQQGFLPLVIVAAISSTIALYYYLRIIVYMYMKPSISEEPVKLFAKRSFLYTGIIGLALTASIILGTLMPGCLYEIISPILNTSLLSH